ncbi:MAG: hypothetical protein ACFB2W_07725 [Leptolyngbyaceae cyanobacterium]
MADISITCATASALSTSRQKLSSPTFESQLKAAIEHASRLNEMYGTSNIDTVIAWKTVEALLKSHAYFRTLVVPNWSLEK